MAAAAPEAATAGTPIPGKVESPQHSRFLIWLMFLGPGNDSLPARQPGPYVPWDRRRKRSCVRGEAVLGVVWHRH